VRDMEGEAYALSIRHKVSRRIPVWIAGSNTSRAHVSFRNAELIQVYADNRTDNEVDNIN
jgi:hypothetical protein